MRAKYAIYDCLVVVVIEALKVLGNSIDPLKSLKFALGKLEISVQCNVLLDNSAPLLRDFAGMFTLSYLCQ